MHSMLLPTQAGRVPWPQSGPSTGPDPAATLLPPTIGSKALIAAAQAGDPGATYEVAIRFTQGRSAGPDLAKAAVWLARAAQAGLAPAQFRLASMYEKGLGVGRDLAEARRLYLMAAAKGHAKAMHNLAVLYTRGVNGPPDYGAAIEWFRKAAAYGTIDSQYNLGILYARGAGVERDLVESYKWFTLAAKGGDKDAAHKRDEVAKGLDLEQQENAKASADAFVAMPQPDEATTVKAPAGGWDQVAVAATTKSRTPGRPERSPGK
jgi:localization factor PodJL